MMIKQNEGKCLCKGMCYAVGPYQKSDQQWYRCCILKDGSQGGFCLVVFGRRTGNRCDHNYPVQLETDVPNSDCYWLLLFEMG